MTPSARLRAAQEILNRLIFSEMSSRVITNWGRQNRVAGSKDRREIRDIIYFCLRNRLYLLHRWGHEEGFNEGRKLVLSFLHELYYKKNLSDLNSFFGNKDYEFSPISVHEEVILKRFHLNKVAIEDDSIRYSYPNFLDEYLKKSLGKDFSKTMNALLDKGSVFIRANKIKISPSLLIDRLRNEGFEIELQFKNREILRVLNPSNKIKLSKLFLHGFFEFQDLGSQEVVNNIQVSEGMSILDFCAGGGGKSLDLISKFSNKLDLYAYDLKSSRLKSFKIRANRAGARVKFLDISSISKKGFDAIIVDAPCSGTGTWRRDPIVKWNLTLLELNRISKIQLKLLNQVSSFINKYGVIYYITCSILAKENSEVVSEFLTTNGDFCLEKEKFISPLQGGDGFFIATLKKIK